MEKINGVKVFNYIPAGWKVVDGANMVPNGYRFISNNKSRWSGEYEHALVPEGIAYEQRVDNT